MIIYKEKAFEPTGKYRTIGKNLYKEYMFDKILKLAGEDIHIMAQSKLLKKVEPIKGFNKTLRHINNQIKSGIGLSNPLPKEVNPTTHNHL